MIASPARRAASKLIARRRSRSRGIDALWLGLMRPPAVRKPRERQPPIVMPGLDPGIHVFRHRKERRGCPDQGRARRPIEAVRLQIDSSSRYRQAALYSHALAAPASLIA